MTGNILMFADTETTGLVEGATGAAILELALVAVELPNFEIVECFSSVVVPPCWPTVKRNLPERVQRMHEISRLSAELDAAHGDAKDCTRWYSSKVEQEACCFVTRLAPKTMSWHTPLAGAGPDFDRRWLSKHMPKLAGLFHYRNYDVRSLTQLQEWVFGVEQAESTHRALPDCLKAVDDVRKFLGLA